MKKIYLVLALGVLALGVSALLSSCNSDSKKAQTELPPLKIGAMSSLDYLPYVIAERMGYTDSIGLQLEIVKFFSANDRDAAFRSGQLDGTIIDYTGAAIQHAAGLPLAIVVKHDGYFEIMARPKITEMSQLRGRKVAVSRNTVIEYATDKMLEASGLEVSEIEKPEVNKIPLRMEMMLSDNIDASVFPDPFITISKQNGCNSLSSTRDLGLSLTGTMFTEKALTEKGESIKALLVAYNRGVDYIKSHTIEELREVLVKDAGVPQDLVQHIVLPNYVYAELPSEKEITETLEWLKHKNLVPVGYSGEGLISGDYLPN
ncbi:MAG: MetQ/NlpA family ABC transporter substrate-binding protein [Porphyromonas sp.]|nr:MetQ/NlpA family ABC transporter substrate-binding protein [Porphyromonas sp.]